MVYCICFNSLKIKNSYYALRNKGLIFRIQSQTCMGTFCIAKFGSGWFTHTTPNAFYFDGFDSCLFWSWVNNVKIRGDVVKSTRSKIIHLFHLYLFDLFYYIWKKNFALWPRLIKNNPLNPRHCGISAAILPVSHFSNPQYPPKNSHITVILCCSGKYKILIINIIFPSTSCPHRYSRLLLAASMLPNCSWAAIK